MSSVASVSVQVANDGYHVFSDNPSRMFLWHHSTTLNSVFTILRSLNDVVSCRLQLQLQLIIVLNALQSPESDKASECTHCNGRAYYSTAKIGGGELWNQKVKNSVG